jgi:hypothetical protein
VYEIGRYLQSGRGQRPEIFDNTVERTHDLKITPRASDGLFRGILSFLVEVR